MDWLRVVKPGGYVLLTHDTHVRVKWEEAQKNLLNEKKWKSIWRSDDLWYFPCCSQEDASTRVRVYVYQKRSSRAVRMPG